MKTRLYLIWALCTALLIPTSAIAGELLIYLFDDAGPVSGVKVILDGEQVATTTPGGDAASALAAGDHTILLEKDGEKLAEFNFTSADKENADVTVSFEADAEPFVAVDTYTPEGLEVTQDSSPDSRGLLKGKVVHRVTREPIAGAEVSFEELTGVVANSNQLGEFEIELPRGVYNIYVSHPEHGQKAAGDVKITANVVNEATFTIGKIATEGLIASPSQLMEELNIVGSYSPQAIATVALERNAGAVTDAIDTEQLLRFGGSTAAAALKKVAGVSLSGNRYVVVRGLNERHSTITLNGSSLPSPDPSRRIVPLDIFPSAILQGIEVQKSATPDQPADSTGGVIRLKTKKYPTEFEGDVSVSLGFVQDLTGEDRLVQKSEGSDFIGFGASDREISGAASFLQQTQPLGLSTIQDQINAGTSLDSAALGTEETTVAPNIGFDFSVGDTALQTDSGMDLGYLLSLRFNNQWSREDSQRRNYINASGQQVRDEVDYTRTVNDIDFGLGFSLGLSWESHQVDSNTFLLRQSQAETNIATGLQGDNRNLQVRTEHRWNEREFFMQQFVGKHQFESFGKTEVNWDFSVSTAELESPDQRENIFRTTSPDDDPSVTLNDIRFFSASRDYVELSDDNLGLNVDLKSIAVESDEWFVELKYGVNYFDRERDAQTQRFTYQDDGSGLSGFENFTRIEDVINADTVASGRFLLSSNTSPTDAYDATWDMTAFYISASAELGEKWRFLVGARAEESDLIVNTFLNAPGQAIRETAALDESDVFPSLNVIYRFSEELQLRGSFYTSINRPDFRELANAQFIDPDSGDIFRGNSNLESADIDNLDLRLEWYLSESESLTLAIFDKQFTNAIEKNVSRIGGGGELFSYQNTDDGFIRGLEFDAKKEFDLGDYFAFISGNLAIIDSEVSFNTGTQEVSRNMQGQPDNLLNIQAGLDDLEGNREYTLTFIHTGESIDSVSQGLPPIVREARMEMDFSFKQSLGENLNHSLKVKLKNILDDEVELTQGGRLFREYNKGIELEVGYGTEF